MEYQASLEIGNPGWGATLPALDPTIRVRAILLAAEVLRERPVTTISGRAERHPVIHTLVL